MGKENRVSGREEKKNVKKDVPCNAMCSSFLKAWCVVRIHEGAEE